VPPRVLYEALGIAPQPHDRRPIKEIAREQKYFGRPTDHHPARRHRARTRAEPFRIAVSFSGEVSLNLTDQLLAAFRFTDYRYSLV